MKRRILALLLCAALIFTLCGCGQEDTPTETTAVPTEPPVSLLYTQAKAPVLEASNLELTVTSKQTITIGAEIFQLETKQSLTYADLGTDTLQLTLTEELDLDGADDKFEEYYSGGTLYVTVYDEYKFKGAVDEAEYLSRFAPAALLDESLYTEITAAQDGDNTMLLFNSPSAAECWAMPENAVFHSAKGSAVIDAEGNLTESSYTIEYTYGGSHISETITSVPAFPEAVTLAAPEDSEYTELESIEAIRLYDMAVMYLYAADAATTNLTETIVSQAAGVVLSSQETVNFHGRSKDHVSEITSAITLIQGTQSETYQQNEHFQDMIYTVSSDGGEPQENTDVGPSAMRSYCTEFLGENLISLDYISSATVSEVGGTLFLELGCNEECGQWLSEYACGVFYDDSNLLNDLATAYVLNDCSAYMAVDKYTGMPTAVGLLYNATHTIEGSDYVLGVQADQSFYLASQTAYETITGESLPEEEPETKATPLFYKVSGADGQEMYLLGTIHVGDARTAYLPQEIYDALSVSDALAVEFDTIAFEEAMSTDTTLAAQIASLYLYTDGTSTKDHLDEETYNAAIKLLKASGNYTAYTEMMKPSIWESSISNFFIQQNYGLSYNKGVDTRLLKLAKENGMEIRDIESGLEQMEMMSGYSDEVQAFLLEDTLSADPDEYYNAVSELFELWCQGDEAVLRKAVLEDTSELTEEETKLFEEYWKAMSTDRNEGMLQVAIDYLESGDTVFYAVGLAHLLADNGLVDTLQEAGYTVEPVAYN